MAQARRLTEKAYVRAVEDAWSRVRGRAVVLSPREFELVAGWRRRGISLALVLEALAHQTRRASRRGGSRSLAALSPAVEAAWEAVAGGRSAALVPVAAALRPDPLLAWRRRAAEQADTGIGRLLARLLAEADRGVSAAELDIALDAEILAAADPALRAAAEAAAEAALAPFRGRMREPELARTRSRATTDHLRAACALPRLTLV